MISSSLPPATECVRVVCGGIPETTELLRNKFDYIFYTGSTNVGKIIHKAANKYLTPCTLELGGKSPVFIDDNCNLETAAKRILWGKMINTGQTCIAPDYVLCSKKTEAKFVKIANELVKTWYGENSADSPDLCRIITERHFDRLMTLMPSDGKNGKALLGKMINQFICFVNNSKFFSILFYIPVQEKGKRLSYMQN